MPARLQARYGVISGGGHGPSPNFLLVVALISCHVAPRIRPPAPHVPGDAELVDPERAVELRHHRVCLRRVSISKRGVHAA